MDLTLPTTVDYPAVKLSGYEIGPRAGIGLRCPSGLSSLSVVGKVQSGLTWSVIEANNDSLRIAGWRSEGIDWSLGFDWNF